jgi:hypothetical protein
MYVCMYKRIVFLPFPSITRHLSMGRVCICIIQSHCLGVTVPFIILFNYVCCLLSVKSTSDSDCIL